MVPEKPEEILELWNTDEIYRRNQELLQKIYRNIQSSVKTNYYFILEYVRYGKNEGGFGLYWQSGRRKNLVINLHYSFKDLNEYEDFQCLFAYGLVGILEFLYSNLFFHPSIPIGRMNIRPNIYVEDEVWKSIRMVRSSYKKFPSSVTIRNPELYPAQCILLDLYEENPFVLKNMITYPSELWDKHSIYAIRQETVSIAVNTQKPDFDVRNLEDLLNGRRMFDFRSSTKEELNFYARKQLAKLNH